MFAHTCCRIAISMAATIAIFVTANAETRTWTDRTGKFSVEAEFVEVNDAKAKLKRADGGLVSVPIAKLSKADQKYLRSLLKPRSQKNDDGPAPAFEGPMASGKIHGQDFTVEQTKFEGGVLILRQGKEFFADLAVVIFLFLEEGESLEGRSFSVTGKEGFTVSTPHVHMKFKEHGGQMPKTQMFMDGYQMEMRFGKATKSVVPGWIDLRLPDESRSRIVGSFTFDLSGELRPQDTRDADDSKKSLADSSDTVEPFRFAFLYKDKESAETFKELIEGNELRVDLVRLRDIEASIIDRYDGLIVASEMGTSFGTVWFATAVDVAREKHKPVLGLGDGGKEFFRKLQLAIGDTMTFTDAWSVKPMGIDELPFWSSFDLDSSNQKELVLYADTGSSQTYGALIRDSVSGVVPIGQIPNKKNYYPIVEQDGRFLLWGFSGSPKHMTASGKQLFIHTCRYFVGLISSQATERER